MNLIVAPDGAPAPQSNEVDIPNDLDPIKLRESLKGVLVKLAGIDVPILEVIKDAKCRPGRPADGCQGRGFALVHKAGGKVDLTLCGCVINAWKRAHAPGSTPALSVARARQVENGEQVTRKRLDRKSAALAEAEAELEAVLAKVAEAVGSLAGDLAVAEAEVLRARARADEASESIRNLAERMRLMKALHEDAIEAEAAARQARVGAEGRVESLRTAIEVAKGSRAAEERQARARVEKLRRRVRTFVAYHPEVAASP